MLSEAVLHCGILKPFFVEKVHFSVLVRCGHEMKKSVGFTPRSVSNTLATIKMQPLISNYGSSWIPNSLQKGFQPKLD